MRKKSISIELGGATRQLKLNLNALAAYEEQTGKSLMALQDDLKGLNMATLRSLLWAMLVTDEPDIQIRDVGEWIDFDNLREVTEKLAEAMKSSLPRKSEGSEGSVETESPFAPAT